MNRDPVQLALERLERPVQPSAEFAESLLSRLLEELESGQATEFPLRRPWFRRVAFAAISLSLAAAVGIALALLLLISPGPSPAQAVIQEAIGNFAATPPFRATIFYDRNPAGERVGIPKGATASIELSYGRQAGFRRQVVAEDPLEFGNFLLGGPGSFIVWDGGEQIGYYRADENAFRSLPARAEFDFLSEFTWNAEYVNWEDICRRGGSEVLSDQQIAGRLARHVRCGDWRGGFWELWIDAETGLMLKVVGALPSDDFRFGSSLKGGFEVRSVEYNPAFAPDTFTVAPPPGARDLTAEREAILGKLPPFRATFTRRVGGQILRDEQPEYTGGDWVYIHTVWYRGENAWRLDIVEDSLPRTKEFSSHHAGGAGSFMVWDGKQIGVYNAVENWFSRREEIPSPEMPLQDISRSFALHPVEGRPTMPSETYFKWKCETLPDDQIAGRPARHLRCEPPDGTVEVWLDAETGLTLKLVNPNAQFELEVTNIEYNPDFPAGVFQFVPPAGARDFAELQEDAYYYTDLVQGQVAPSWKGPLRGGGTLDLKSLRGRPVLILFSAEWCDRACDVLPQLQQAYQQWAGRASLVAVFFQSQDAGVEKIIQKGGYTFPVVMDSSGKVGKAWGVQAVPLWVLLDAEGRVVEVRIRPQTLAELNDLLSRR